MKTIRNKEDSVKRVDDSTASMLVNNGLWTYCSKDEYKKLSKGVRVSNVTNSEKVAIEHRGLSDKKLRKERKLAKSKKNI
jgi:hypothetical protein|tara:strand:+ start:539 stop:778 length:240 start_codon:yes stop_codon:yes gene_type:complete